METAEKIKNIADSYGVDFDIKKYKNRIVLLEKIGFRYEKTIEELKERIMESAICDSMKVVRDEKGLVVPSWFQKAVTIEYHYNKKKVIVFLEVEYFVRLMSQKVFFEEVETNEDFYKAKLPDSVWKTYEMKRAFNLREAEQFLKKEIDGHARYWVANLRKERRITRMGEEIYDILDVEFPVKNNC